MTRASTDLNRDCELESATETDGDTTSTETDIDVVDDGYTIGCRPLSDTCPFLEGEKVFAYSDLRVYPPKVIFLSFFFFLLNFHFGHLSLIALKNFFFLSFIFDNVEW